MLTYAVFPMNDEFCVAHMGVAKVCGQDGFQTCWIVDDVCPTKLLAVEAMDARIKMNAQNARNVQADIKALERRRF